MANIPKPSTPTTQTRVVDVAPPKPKVAESSMPSYGPDDKLRGTKQKVGEVDRQKLQDSALGITVSPGLKTKITQTKELYQKAVKTSAAARQSAVSAIAATAQLPGIPPAILSFATRLNQQIANNQQKSARRQRESEQLTKSIKRTFVLVVVGAFVVAGIADILSIWDCGWVVSWCIPIFTFFMARRINKINHGAQRIEEAQQRASREVALLQQRLQHTLSARQRFDLLRRSVTQKIVARFSSYFTQYLIETLGVQGLELVPVLDWLPMYLGDVVKITIDQYNAYQKAQRLIPQLQRTFAMIEQLEAFEITHLTQQLSILVQRHQQQLILSAQRRRIHRAQQIEASREIGAIENAFPQQSLKDIQPVFQQNLAPVF